MSTPGPSAGKTLSERTLGGMLWMGGASAAQMIMQIVCLAVLARLLTPADFGIAAASNIIIAFSMLFSDLALGPALIQRDSLTGRHVRTAFTASTLLGLLLCLAIYLLSGPIAGFFRLPQVEPVTRLLGIVFIWQGLSTVSENLLSRHLQFRRLAAIKIASYVLGYGAISIVMAYRGWGYWSLAGGFIGQSLINMLLVMVLARHDVRPLLHLDSLMDLARFGGGLSLGRIINYLALNGDKLVIGRLIGGDALGLYDRAYKLASLPGSLYEMAASKVALSSLSRVQNEPQRLRAAYRRGIELTALIGMPMTALMIVLAPQIIDVLLGPQWHHTVLPFIILSVSTFSRLSYRVSNSVLFARGRVYTFVLVQIAYAAIVIGGSWLAAPLGITGIAAVVTVAITLNSIVLAGVTIRLTGMGIGTFLMAHLPGCLMALVFAGTAAAVVAAVGSMLAPAAVLGFAGIAVTAAVVAVLAVPSRVLWGEDGLWLRGKCLTIFRGRPAANPPMPMLK
jgi:O-antigen/teichoic acid export membrane protein